ncbi:MAG: hypothetical protein TREMPRED_002466 [Tremellales sp. Tagirdzhanova-0007]|nr:MAG: hypothetical protein TREMPRED_002466 [Tremellales sp. Tagirdzhanova-0007]
MTTSPNAHERVASFLKEHPKIRHVRYVIHDYHNVPRCMLTTSSRALTIAQNPTQTGAVTSATSINYCAFNTGHYDFSLMVALADGDHWVPVWETLKCTTRDDQAMVLCTIKEMKEPEANWFDRDPRSVLQRLVNKAKDEFGLEFSVGYEIEFQLLKSMNELEAIEVPAEPYGSCSVRDPSFDVLLETVETLEDSGIQVWKYHAEVGRGVYELSFSPNDPMTATDNLIFALETIKSVAKQHGSHATIHPKPFETAGGLGQHMHISVNKGELSDSFLAGIVGHIRSICAVLMGAYDSYGIRDHVFGGGLLGWSMGKTAPIRRIGESRFEIRIPDGLGNPYLQIASLLGIGMDGVRKQTKLEMKGVPAVALTDEVAKECGITDRVPASQKEAIEAMEKNKEVMVEVLGEKCFETYVQHRKSDTKHASKMPKTARNKQIVMNI